MRSIGINMTRAKTVGIGLSVLVIILGLAACTVQAPSGDPSETQPVSETLSPETLVPETNGDVGGDETGGGLTVGGTEASDDVEWGDIPADTAPADTAPAESLPEPAETEPATRPADGLLAETDDSDEFGDFIFAN